MLKQNYTSTREIRIGFKWKINEYYRISGNLLNAHSRMEQELLNDYNFSSQHQTGFTNVFSRNIFAKKCDLIISLLMHVRKIKQNSIIPKNISFPTFRFKLSYT